VPGEEPPPFAKPEYGFYRRNREVMLALPRAFGVKSLKLAIFQIRSKDLTHG
jgi:hypothetical protein